MSSSLTVSNQPLLLPHCSSRTCLILLYVGNRKVSVFEDSTNKYDKYRVQSRNLARSMLRRHIASIPDLRVLSFRDDSDSSWENHVRTRKVRAPYLPFHLRPFADASGKPMFVMCNSGGHPKTNGPRAEDAARRALHMRSFISRLLSGGIAVAALDSMDVIDSKVGGWS